MGYLKQNKIEDDFSKKLSQRADDLVAEMCQCVPPVHSNIAQQEVKEHNNLYLTLFLEGWEAYTKEDYRTAFDNIESVRSIAVQELGKIENHDCHLSQDSSCETCEEIWELKDLIDRAEKLMFKINDRIEQEN